MIILEILFAIIIGFFALGLLGALIVFIMALNIRRKLRQAMANMPNNNQTTNQNDHNELDVELIQCPHCGTFIEAHHNICESCGKSTR